MARGLRRFVAPSVATLAMVLVAWVQKDDTLHTTTSGVLNLTTGVWDSGFLSQDQTFTFTFTEAVTFPYFCEVHPFMTATVTVTDQ